MGVAEFAEAGQTVAQLTNGLVILQVKAFRQSLDVLGNQESVVAAGPLNANGVVSHELLQPFASALLFGVREQISLVRKAAATPPRVHSGRKVRVDFVHVFTFLSVILGARAPLRNRR